MKRISDEMPFLRTGLGIREAPLYYAAYGAWLLVALMNTTTLSGYIGKTNIVYLVVPFALLIDEIRTGTRSKREYAFLVIATVLNLQTWLIGGNNLAAISMFLFTARNKRFDDILKVTVVVDIVILTVIPALSYFGIISNVVNVRTDGTIRSSMGFGYVTYASYVLLNFVLSGYVLLRNSKPRTLFAYSLIVLILNLYIYQITDARNGFILIIASVISCCLTIMLHPKFRTNHVLNICLSNSHLIIMVVFSILVAFYWAFPNNDIAVALNSLTSSRLEITSYAIERFGIPIFGGTKENLVQAGLVIDCSYFRIIFEHGLIALAVLLASLMIVQERVIQCNDFLLYVVMSIVAIHSAFDAQLISIQHNVFILLLAYLINKKPTECFSVTTQVKRYVNQV